MTVDEALEKVDSAYALFVHRRSSLSAITEEHAVLASEVRRLREEHECAIRRVEELEAAAHELRDTILHENDGLEVNYVLDLIDNTIGQFIQPIDNEPLQSVNAEPEVKAEVSELMRNAKLS